MSAQEVVPILDELLEERGFKQYFIKACTNPMKKVDTLPVVTAIALMEVLVELREMKELLRQEKRPVVNQIATKEKGKKEG